MKTLYLFIFSICLSFSSGAQVQYYPDLSPSAEEESLDANIRTCLADSQFESDFSLSDWSAHLQYYTRKLIQRLSSEFVGEIAQEKEKVQLLNSLSADCPELAKVQKELAAISKIYEKKIIYQKTKGSTGLFEEDEVKAKMDKGDAEDLLKYLEKMQKKLGISRKIIRIL